MYLNTFASALEPIGLTETEEFSSLLKSATELGLSTELPVRYQSRNLVLNGLRFHVLEWGEPSAPALLFLHGGNQTAHSWDLVSLVLAPRYHIIALDQRGHGDSEWPRDAESTRHSMADDARQVIETMNLRNPTVFGHSMGGTVAMTLLIANPHIAKKAVLVDIGPEVAPEGRERIQQFVQSAREFSSIDEYVERVAAYDRFRSTEHIGRTVGYNLMRRADGKFVSKHSPFRGQFAVGAAAPLASPPTLAEVAGITCPVLVTRGERSNILLPEAAERFVQALPNGRLVTVPRCGHNVHSQNTPGFLESVVPFLEAD
jgi:pimeloyl-ACP methyl ester carboxylesterase